jgi:hypothetical protein
MARRRFLLILLGASLLVAGTAARSMVSTHGSAKINCTQTPRLVLNGRVVNLSGTWVANDGGTYWLHQVGNCLWWSGFSGQPDTPTMGKDFANVYVGRVGKNATSGAPEVVGYWADVPRGATNNFGSMVLGGLKFDATGTIVSFVKVRGVGAFGGSAWKRIS